MMFSRVVFYSRQSCFNAAKFFIKGLDKEIREYNLREKPYFCWGWTETRQTDIEDGVLGADDLLVDICFGDSFKLVDTTETSPRTAIFYIPGVNGNDKKIDWKMEVPRQFTRELIALTDAIRVTAIANDDGETYP